MSKVYVVRLALPDYGGVKESILIGVCVEGTKDKLIAKAKEEYDKLQCFESFEDVLEIIETEMRL